MTLQQQFLLPQSGKDLRSQPRLVPSQAKETPSSRPDPTVASMPRGAPGTYGGAGTTRRDGSGAKQVDPANPITGDLEPLAICPKNANWSEMVDAMVQYCSCFT